MTITRVVNLAVSLSLTAGIVLAQQASPPPSTNSSDEPFAFQLLNDGNGYLGVYAEDINQENLNRYGLREARGVGITEVVKDSPADRAGVRKGDVILRFDNDSVTSTRKLNRMVSEVAPDQRVTLRISRGGAEQDLSVTIGKRKNAISSVQSLEGMPGLKGLLNGEGREWKWEVPQGEGPFVYSFGNNRRIGVSTTTLTKQLADFFGVTDGKGVLVTSVEADSPAARAGLKAGDVITAVDGEKIEGAGDLSRAINKQKDGEVTLTVIRDKSPRTIKVTPTKPDATLTGRITAEDRRAIRDAIRDGVLSDVHRIVIPRIELPTIPEINIRTPRIELPTTPEIDVVVPTPRVKVIRAPRQPI